VRRQPSPAVAAALVAMRTAAAAAAAVSDAGAGASGGASGATTPGANKYKKQPPPKFVLDDLQHSMDRGERLELVQYLLHTDAEVQDPSANLPAPAPAPASVSDPSLGGKPFAEPVAGVPPGAAAAAGSAACSPSAHSKAPSSLKNLDSGEKMPSSPKNLDSGEKILDEKQATKVKNRDTYNEDDDDDIFAAMMEEDEMELQKQKELAAAENAKKVPEQVVTYPHATLTWSNVVFNSVVKIRSVVPERGDFIRLQVRLFKIC
jgi:hypothetical protein